MAKVVSFNNVYQSGWQMADPPFPYYNDMHDNRPRLYLWAAGGTGMRVVSSLIMLCASGFLNDIEIIPVLFDIDDSCSSLNYAIRELELYHKIYKETENHNNTSKSFFGCFIHPIMVGSNNKLLPFSSYSFKLDLHWKEKIGGKPKADEQLYRRASPEALELMKSLFGASYIKDLCYAHESSAPYSSSEIRLLLGKLEQDEDFRHMLEIIDPFRDKVIVVGSAFGATGTAFVYELIQSLKNNSFTNRLPKALVLMEPFFQVIGSGLTDEIMKKRAQESISFFNECNIYKELNITYLIGAGTGFEAGRLSKGGEVQKNPNSIHEFIGALAIADFCKRISFGKEPLILNYAMPRTTTNKINISNITGTPEETEAMSLLTRFALAMKYVYNNEKDVVSPKVKNFSMMFYQWISEMERVDQDSFVSFEFDQPGMHNILKGRKFTKQTFLGMSKPLFTLDDFIKGMSTVKRENKENPLDLYLRQLEAGAEVLMQYVSV